MKQFEFELRFQLPPEHDDPEEHLDALFEAGCDDALIGTGVPGSIALDFCREADNAMMAVGSAVRAVLAAIPGSTLVFCGPDLLNLTEIATVVSERLQMNLTRQAMRKYAMGELAHVTRAFPSPSTPGSAPLWHLAEVMSWLEDNNKLRTSECLFSQVTDMAKSARALNLANATYQAEIDDETNLMKQAMEIVQSAPRAEQCH